MASQQKGRESNLKRRLKKIIGIDKKLDPREELKDWALAFLFAAVFYFIIFPAILGTSSPGIVVASCSEQGYLNVGDILVLQGVDIKDINAPEVFVSKYAGFIPFLDENGEVTEISVSGQIVELNRSNDIIVYNAYPAGYQIIHRVFAKIKTNDGYLLLTKGDANNLLDQMTPIGMPCVDDNVGCLSTPVTQKMFVGKMVLFPIPLLGHTKLFFCDLTFGRLCDGHSNLGTNYEYVLSC